MWFWLSLAAVIFWSGSDLFSKIGCRGEDDRLSHLKMVTAVGIVMGLHCLYEVLSGAAVLSLPVITAYLPVSAFYILSMAIGYLGLRYIELSISSPVCNCSGAVVAILTFITMGRGAVNGIQLAAVAAVCVGVIMLGFVEANEDEQIRRQRQEAGNFVYAKSAAALAIPIIYCLLDSIGTFADSIILKKLDENSANAAYELTFFAVGIICMVYTRFVKKSKYTVKKDAPKYIGAVCETAGQFAYIFALADSKHVMLSAPIVSSYCIVSVILGRIFLKERLSRKHYAAIATAAAGIIIIGMFDV